jgi:hypothetical protein
VTLRPDRQQLLLLHAALDDGPAAGAAFAQWAEGVDLAANVEVNSFRLLPLAAANMRRTGTGHPLLARLDGVHRHFWASIQLLFAAVAKPLRALRQAEVPVMASKGLALAAGFYASPALRPMADIDILVPPDRVAKAGAVLNAAGWREVRERRAGTTLATKLATQHAMTFADASGHEIDLHWRPVQELGSAAAIAQTWRVAQPLAMLGVELVQPSAAHLLLHAVLHGIGQDSDGSVRWISDTAMILRSRGEEIDWSRLIAFARRERVAYRLALALEFVAEEFALSVPASVLTDLLRQRVGLFERIEYRLHQRPAARPRRVFDRLHLAMLLRIVADGRASALPAATVNVFATRLATIR